jgi:hypothetical protein
MRVAKELVLHKEDLNREGRELLIEEVQMHHIAFGRADVEQSDRTVYEDPIGNRKVFKDRRPGEHMKVVFRPDHWKRYSPTMDQYNDYVATTFKAEYKELEVA